MGELGALFNPGMRHEQEERRAKELRREEEGNSRDVDPRIDLESGVAVITTGDGDPAESVHGADPAAGDRRSVTAADGDTGPAAPPRPRPRGKRGLNSSR